MEKVIKTRRKRQSPAPKPFIGGHSYFNTEQSFFSPSIYDSSVRGEQVVQRQVGPPTENKQPQIAPKETEGTSNELGEPAEKNNLRDELDRLFKEFEQMGVGDEIFDTIKTKEAWDTTKKEEATAKAAYKIKKEAYDKEKAKYKVALNEWRKNPKLPKPQIDPPPIPVATYTTCIDTQGVLFKKALQATGLKIKKVSTYDGTQKKVKGSKPGTRYDFATTGMPQAIEAGAWHMAGKGEKERPKKGDIIILAFRGSSIDEAEKLLKYVRDTAAPQAIAKATEADERAQAALPEIKEANDAAMAALAALEAANTTGTSSAMINARGKVKLAAEAFRKAKKKAEETAAALKKAQDMVPERQKTLENARQANDHKYFEFSHVGFFQSLQPNGDGTETWITFDGGQTLKTAKGDKQGARSTRRIYNPVTNEIAGEASQGGTVRWLQGWVDIEKLVEPPKTE